MTFMKTLLLGSCGLIFMSCAGRVSADTPLSRYKERQLANLGRFEPEKMVQVHSVMNDLFLRLWDSEDRKILYEYEAETFAPRYPVLQLLDVDGDDVAEQFAYERERGGDSNSQEFGYFFDLDRDSRIDYVIFYGGPMMSEGAESMWWMNYHDIDSNADGKTDHALFQGSTDLNRNRRVEPEIGLWLIDVDLDGLLDRAVYLADGFERPVRIRRGRLDLSRNLILEDNDVMVGEPVSRLGDALLSDINEALKSGSDR